MTAGIAIHNIVARKGDDGIRAIVAGKDIVAGVVRGAVIAAAGVRAVAAENGVGTEIARQDPDLNPIREEL